jgi:hypothetical protein
MVDLGQVVDWSFKLTVDSGGWLVAVKVNYFLFFPLYGWQLSLCRFWS